MFEIPPRTLRRKASIRAAAVDVIQGGMSVSAAARKNGLSEIYLRAVSAKDKWRAFQDDLVEKPMRPALALVAGKMVMNDLVSEQFEIFRREVAALRERAMACEAALPHLDGPALGECVKVIKALRIEIEARIGMDIVRKSSGNAKTDVRDVAPVGTVVELE